METIFQTEFWQFWNPELKISCENSNTLCMAVFSIDGELLFANTAMKVLFMDNHKESFINPQFETILKIDTHEYPLFNGLITFGKINSSKNITIQTKVFRRGNQLLLIGEIEVNQLVIINNKLLELNAVVNELQRKAIKEKKILTQSELRINGLLLEKETLLREVHHRVKNNIASIEGMLSLQADDTNNDEVKTALRSAISHIQSMRVLYDKLLLNENYREVSIKNYIESLIDSIVAVFPDSGNITIEKQIDDFTLNTNKIVPIGMAINEILTNVFKYAFIGRDSGHISVTINKIENYVTLTIQDNGVGLDDDFDFDKTSGFGINIIKMLAKSYSIENNEGTMSILKFDI